MFGLFDPPNIVIRKRTPSEYHTMFDLMESTAAVDTGDLDPTRQSYILGAIMSVWVFNNATAGNIKIKDFNLRYIQNLGLACMRKLDGEEEMLLREILDAMRERSLL